MLSEILCAFLLAVQANCYFDTNTLEVLNTMPRDVEKVLSVVSLKKRSYDWEEYWHFCGGTILNKEWILTAGHCLTKKGDFQFLVDVGTVHLANDNGTRHSISSFYIHPNQTESKEIFKNDLGLIKLQQPISFTPTVQPVHLGTIKDQKEVPVTAGGWGRVSQYGQLHQILRYVHFNTLRFKKCQRLHARRNNIVDRVTHICGYGGFGKSVCFGDSGGPLFDVATGYQVGVFSTLEDCSGNFPALFMRIESYLDWINSVMKLDLTID